MQLSNDIIVYENVYQDPNSVRNIALNQFENMIDETDFHFINNKPNILENEKKNCDVSNIIENEYTSLSFFTNEQKYLFENLLNKKIILKNKENGVFKLQTALSYPIKVNINKNFKKKNEWIGIVFLTPNAPKDGGISFKIYKKYGISKINEIHLENDKIKQSLLNEIKVDSIDDTKWLEDTIISNRYNRLILFNKNLFYKSNLNFGLNINESRLYQYFDFEVIDEE